MIKIQINVGSNTQANWFITRRRDYNKKMKVWNYFNIFNIIIVIIIILVLYILNDITNSADAKSYTEKIKILKQ